MLPAIAGIVSMLIQNNLPKVAQSVVDKGLDYVSDKLGIELKPQMTPEEIQKVSEAAMKHEEFMITQDNLNTANARDTNVKIQESTNASWLAKNTAYIIDFGIVGAAVLMTYVAFFAGIPPANEQVVLPLVGSLWTYAGVIINFHRGTSAGSSKKTDLLLAKNKE